MKRTLLVLLILAASIAPAFAQVGGGVVFDPTNYKNALLRYMQLQQQLLKLEQTYNLHMQQYQFLLAQARQIQNMEARYKAPFSNWHNLTSANTFGNTGLWVSGSNSGNLSTITSGYAQIVPPLESYSGSLSPFATASYRSQQGMLELNDAANLQSLETLGEIRGNAQQIQAMLSRLEDDSLSPDDQLNTEVAVLNKINAANVVLARSIQDTNKLLLAMLEQMTQSNAQQRRVQGDSLNTNIRAQQMMQQTFAAFQNQPLSSGPFRLP